MSARVRLDDLAGMVAALQTDVADLARRVDRRPANTTAGQQKKELKFPDVESWVAGNFLPMFGWRVDGQRWHWCPQWWRHAEAIWRLELLWRSWEVARHSATGMSSWSTEVDRHLGELLGDDGPFRQCRAADDDREARHTDLPPATAEPAPEGWWK